MTRPFQIASSLLNTPFAQLHPNAQFALRLALFIAVHLLKKLAHPAARVAHRVLRDVNRAPDSATLKDVIEKCFKGVAFSYNNSRMILTCPNGSTVWFGGLDEGDKSDGLLGSDWSTLLFDEVNAFIRRQRSDGKPQLARHLKRLAADGAGGTE